LFSPLLLGEGCLSSLLIFFAPPIQYTIGQVVLSADLSWALLSTDDLTRYLYLELSTVNPSFHSCSPWSHCLSTGYDMLLENLPFVIVRSYKEDSNTNIPCEMEAVGPLQKPMTLLTI
jgi:hypothetical protein